ncbi:MAG: hypothetical protein CVV27_11795 [Candidatus Melainabacteria bacterium HGW-Melainabacteria-1]|nr:MAG: hypothetical protein CVV27_11795 [Candidatus Melainabacteria bacterium HGW-Melainabacteria-1]
MSNEHSQIKVEGRLGCLAQYCPDCQRVSLRYGNILMPLTQERFAEFRLFLGETCQRHFAQAKAPELRFRFSELLLCFTKSEAEALLDVVEQAHTEICRFRLEQLFTKTGA